MMRQPPASTLFPCTALFRSTSTVTVFESSDTLTKSPVAPPPLPASPPPEPPPEPLPASRPSTDRKSTRLNSSHANISHAVFCLNKKGAADVPLLPTPRLDQ